ncbi:addiction module component [Pedosphaera parvula Ellin514]|uniref:Addiction module component n=2 Tax=Pedosphaera TaxID=1032526 RepID=B9XMB9_PEDPL|nr:addiction module component [Pedosphaera parvula Ellin514]
MLANHLLRSLNDAPLSSMDELWVNEAERRYQHFKAGMTEAIPEDKIFSQIREELRWPT